MHHNSDRTSSEFSNTMKNSQNSIPHIIYGTTKIFYNFMYQNIQFTCEIICTLSTNNVLSPLTCIIEVQTYTVIIIKHCTSITHSFKRMTCKRLKFHVKKKKI